jgi:hypothetical protein
LRRSRERPTPGLKIDVQGVENSVLDGGCWAVTKVTGVQVEMPLVAVYEGQMAASQTIARLEAVGLRLVGVYPGFFDEALGLNPEFDGMFLGEAALHELIAKRVK